MPQPDRHITPHDALLVVDVQNDFLPGGALAVADGNRVVPSLNRHIAAFVKAGALVVATRDWHPPGHGSFTARGGPWPPHCVAGTAGAAFAPGLALPPGCLVVSKGERPDGDAYSGFDGTGLAATLRERGVQRVFVGGLATDYCVQATVLDAIKAGFATFVLSDSVRAVNAHPGDGRAATLAMQSAGAVATDLRGWAGGGTP
ncbi:MAG: nicotinamidase [Nitrospirae bacterium]|nr:nicotinamidase [Nitrospirota bacterium]